MGFNNKTNYNINNNINNVLHYTNLYGIVINFITLEKRITFALFISKIILIYHDGK